MNSVESTLTVPAISCSGVGSHTAGQLLGVELFGTAKVGGHNKVVSDFAGILVKCTGQTASYSPEFRIVNPNTGATTYSDGSSYRSDYSVQSGGKLVVTPGDLRSSRSSIPTGGENFSITDMSTPNQQPEILTGTALHGHKGWEAGLFERNGLLGPVPSTPALFTDVSAGGHTFGNLSSPFSTDWTNEAGKHAAVVGPYSKGKSEFTAFTSNAPEPWLSHNTSAGVASGEVLYELPRTHHFVNLKSVKQLPNGTTIDTSFGHVELSFGLHGHQTQTAVLWGGQFKFTQNKNGQTTFVVVGTFQPEGGKGPHAISRKAKKKKTLGNLWSSGHGNFTTKGNNGAAAVRGTTWLTRNQSNGTFFEVTKNRYDKNDQIVVTVFYPKPHKVILRQGQSLLAPNPTTSAVTLGGATETDGRYNVTVGSRYTLTLTSKTRPVYVDAPMRRSARRATTSRSSPMAASTESRAGRSPSRSRPTWPTSRPGTSGVLVGQTLYVVPLRIVS